MTSRRQFVTRAASSIAALPLVGMLVPQSSPNVSEWLQRTDLENDEYWQLVRSLFPFPKDEAYFNTGTLGVMPTPVLDKMTSYMRRCATEAPRTDYMGNGPLLLSGYEAYVDLRKKVGLLINCDYQEVALTQNATFGMNYISNGLNLKADSEIIQTDQEHGGGSAGWRVLAKRYGFTYKSFEMPVPANDPDEIMDRLFAQVTDRTRIIAVPHIISVYGVILPVKQICAEARNRGIFTILDGAQSVGQIKVDVKDIGCDAYFSSLHKWMLAPAGSGILYIARDRMADVHTTLASYQWDNDEDPGFRLTQRGTSIPALEVGFEAAIDIHNQIGSDRWIARVKFLGDYLRSGLSKIEKVKIHSPTNPEMCAGLTTYGAEGIKGPDLQKKMWETHKLQPRAVGEQGVRHSTHIYNSVREIDKALEVVASI